MNLDSTVPLRTGRAIPVLGLGTWQLTKDTAGTVECALRLGYPMVDTSVDYGTQPGIGEAIRRSGLDRDEIYVVTKVEEYDDAYKATQRNLRELGLDHVDLTLIHRPPPHGPGEELWEGLIRAREEGLTRDIGVSNYSIELIEQLVEATGEVPAVNQVEWTPFGWSRELLDHAHERGIVVQAYSPLTRAKRLDDDRPSEIAAEYGKTTAQLLIRWNLQLGTPPIPKANQRDHLEENLDIFNFEIRDEHMAELGELNESWSSLGVSLAYV
jgi:2,5-diketo-D-gluconate reductase A